MQISSDILYLLCGILGLLAISSIIAFVIKKTASNPARQNMADNLRDRVNSWWLMCFVFAMAMVCGKLVTIVLFSCNILSGANGNL